MNDTLRKQLIATLINIIGAALAARGLITVDQASTISGDAMIIAGPILMVCGIVYTAVTHTASAQIENTARLSQVKRIVTTDRLMALKIARPDVVHEDINANTAIKDIGL